jgi:DNA repair exonuclease SbcCD ATPase subunit
LTEESWPTRRVLTPELRRWISAPDYWTTVLKEESLPPESALTTGTQERVGIPGVLTETIRITGGSSSNQRQLQHYNRDFQMVKGKHKNHTNGNQEHWASSEPSTPTTMSPGYPNTSEKQDADLKSYLMMVVEDFKKGNKNSLKEIQDNTAKQVEALKEEAQKILKELKENTDKQVEALKQETQKFLKELQENTAKQVEVLKELQANTAKRVEETQKSLKEIQENTTKQAMKLNKTIQDLKMEVETMKKTQRDTTLEIETLEKKSATEYKRW